MTQEKNVQEGLEVTQEKIGVKVIHNKRKAWSKNYSHNRRGMRAIHTSKAWSESYSHR